jgi:hypothetical protein
MDGKSLGQMCPPLARGTIPTIDSSPQLDNEHAELPHGRGIEDIPCLCGHLRGLRSVILPTRARSAASGPEGAT